MDAGVGERIKGAREAAGLSQKALAAAVGTSKNWLGRVERSGDNREDWPSGDLVRAIADALDVEVEVLTTGGNGRDAQAVAAVIRATQASIESQRDELRELAFRLDSIRGRLDAMDELPAAAADFEEAFDAPSPRSEAKPARKRGDRQKQ